MTTIKEDYCSYEVAKLLKEKGFNEFCYTYYDGIDNSINRFDKGLHFKNTSYPWGVPYDVSKAKKYIITPTHQMAMKWLRKIHNISIEPFVDFGSGDEHWWTADVAYIKKDGLIDELCGYNSYEEAAEAGIKYCLENLI